MNEHDATELAYKRGYQQGVKDLAERVKKYYSYLKGDTVGVSVGYYVDVVAKEMGVEL